MKKKLIIIILVIIVVIIGFIVYVDRKIIDAEVELGGEITEKDFVSFGSSSLVSVDLSNVNINKVGEYPVIVNYLLFSYNRVINVVDKTPPVLEVKNISKKINYSINPSDFVVKVSDQSKYFLKYEGNANTKEYGEYTITIVASDIYNNITKKEAKLLIGWVKSEYTTEIGNEIKISDLIYDLAESNTIDANALAEINKKGEGTYYLKSSKNGITVDVKIVKTKDVTPPELKLKDVTIYEGKRINDVNDFVQEATDKGSKVTLKLLSNINYNTLGEQKVEIEASDIYGNKVVKEATLKIIKDTDGPKIFGLTKISTKKRSKVDYTTGVSSYDENTGNCQFTYDDSKVDLLNYGLYTVIYTSTDALGNKTTEKRIVEVIHDSSDVSELVRKKASELSNDVEKIRDYVRNNINYNSEWGGDDPVWYGLTYKIGNCYVHASVFDALLIAKGYTTKLIWTTDKTHYWNMVYLNGKWVHMDSTPGPSHSKYSIMNDEQRYERLQGRNWDRSLWPKAE